jgi:hypothetical protein
MLVDDAGLPVGNCSDWGWCVQSPQPNYTGVWGFSATDAWAVQGNGVSYWDGAQWKRVFGGQLPYVNDAGVTVDNDLQPFSAVWGTSDNDMWFVGSDQAGNVFHWDGQHWSSVTTVSSFIYTYQAIWGAAADDIWTGGNVLLHWDGCVWTSSDNPVLLGQQMVNSIWGSSGSDVWAVGSGSLGGLLFHFDGGAWTSAFNPLSDAGAGGFSNNASLGGVWGSSSTDVWAVGDDQSGATYGTILHNDGTGWQSVTVPSSAFPPGLPTSLSGVWGSGPGDVWAFGATATGGGGYSVLLHYDGGSWAVASNPFSGADEQRQFVVGWGSSASDVWALGAIGTVAHYDGGSWSNVWDTTGNNLSGVWGAATDDVWAASNISGNNGGELLHWNGKSWASAFVTDGGLQPQFGSISGSGSSDVWIASGTGGAFRWDGTSWSFVGNGVATGAAMSGVWVDSASNRWMVGLLGRVYQNVGNTSWASVSSPSDGTDGGFYSGSGSLNAVWGVSGGPLYAVGTSHIGDGGLYNTILMGQASGGALLDVSQPEPDPSAVFTTLNGVGGVSAQDFWVCGSRLYHYANSTWTLVTPPANLQGVYNGVWGAAANDVWIVGGDFNNNPVLLHWDGSGLTPATYPDPTRGLGARAIFGFGTTDIWYVGTNGGIEHY